MEGNTEEQNNASPSRREELHLCLISSNTLSWNSLSSQIFTHGFYICVAVCLRQQQVYICLTVLADEAQPQQTHKFVVIRVPANQIKLSRSLHPVAKSSSEIRQT